MKRKSRILFAIYLVVSMVFSNVFLTQAATVTKNVKTYEIAVVFDNSGSMYNNQAWCRAKYAMEIFSSMLHYDSGDVLKIFPMWPVTTDGSKPASGGSHEGIEIRSSSDINKISNLYSVSPSNTPFAPITEAYNVLQASGAKEKWLIVLTDGKFNEEARGQNAKINLQNRLLDLSSENIKVQYLGIGEAETLASDESKCFYAKKSSDVSLKDDLISVCNTIFQRSILPKKYISGNTLNLDMSMNNLIVFAQGADAKISGLKNESGESVPVKLDSGQRKFSTISAGGNYSNAPVDNTLAGQVVTFDECPKGNYELVYSGAEAIEIFYEPNVDIKMTLINDDGQEVDYTQGSIPPGEYTISYGLVDAKTGEDVTQSELMGNGVKWNKSVIKPSNKEEFPFENGGKITLEPDDSTKVIIEGTYLKDYTISTEDDPRFSAGFHIPVPKIKELKLELATEQASSWYQIGKEGKWKPIRANLTLAGMPLTDEQLANVKLDLNFSDNIAYTVKPISGESACEILIGYDENGKYRQPNCGSYKLDAKATFVDEFGQEVSDTDKIGFDVQKYSAIWRWLKWILILLALLALITYILNRPTLPNSIYMNIHKGSHLLKRNGTIINLSTDLHMGELRCEAKPCTPLKNKGKPIAKFKIKRMIPRGDVLWYEIDGSRFTKNGNKYVNDEGETAESTVISDETEVRWKTNNSSSVAKGTVYINHN